MIRARPLDTFATVTIVVLCTSWGLNQAAIKSAMPDIPPLIQCTVRSAGALVMLLAWCRWKGVRLLGRDGTLLPGLAAGALFGFEFLIAYKGIALTTASRGTIFLYTAPFFVALGGAWFLPGERLSASQWAGLVLSFAGVVVAFWSPAREGEASTLSGDLLMLAAGILWAATTLVLKGSRLVRVAAEKSFAYQLVVSIPILGIGALAFGETITEAPRAAAIGWLAYQTIWVVGITYGLWFWLVKEYSTSRLSVFTFLTPLSGVAAGHVLLGDAMDWPFAVAAALVVAGLVLVNRPR